MRDQDLFVLEKLFIPEVSSPKVSGNKEVKGPCENKAKKKVKWNENTLELNNDDQENSYSQSRDFEYIQNPDGTIRWIWPKENNSPDFLKFYSAMSAKAVLNTWLMKIIFYMPLFRNVLIKDFSVVSNSNLFVDDLTSNKSGEYAVFTGTVGPNRKIVVYNKHTDKKEFLKIPVGKTSSSSLSNEYHNSKLFEEHLDCLEIPEIRYENSVLSSSDLEIKTNKTVLLLHSTQEVLLKLIDRTWYKQPVTFVLGEVNETDNPELIDLQKVLTNVLNEKENTVVDLSLNHGDFTPWNTFQEAEKLKIYDLEFASKKLPVYYDVFHYWTQNLLMCTDLNFEEILSTIRNNWDTSLFLSHSQRLSLKFEKVWSWYILFVAHHYYNTYSKQDKIHIQGRRLINFLTYFLDKVSTLKEEVTLREKYIEKVSDVLKKHEHAIIKQFGEIKFIAKTDSDVDMVMRKQVAKKFLLELPEVGVVSKAIKKKSYMITVELFFADQSFLSIDLIHEFKRTLNYYLDIKYFLDKSFKRKDGLSYACPVCNSEYIFLFYLLNNSPIAEKYIKHMRTFPPVVYDHLCNFMKEKYGIIVSQLLGKNKPKWDDARGNVKQYIENRKENKSLIRYLKYYRDVIGQLFFSTKAPLISFSGVDGAGKTTVLYAVKEILEKRYRKHVVVIRHRPSVLPILSAYVHGKEKASEISMSKLPRQGGNKNVISSLVRFCYYYLDYIIGQVIISYKYSRRDIIVLYDRYYYDFILDGIRSNINLKSWFPKSLFWSIKKPALNFFLYASPEVILSRKQELDKEDILELTAKYTGLFKKYESKYKQSFEAIENIELERTIPSILDSFIHKIRRS